MTYKPWMDNVNPDLLYRYFRHKAKNGEWLRTPTMIYYKSWGGIFQWHTRHPFLDMIEQKKKIELPRL